MSRDRIPALLDTLAGLETDLYNGDFLLTWERTLHENLAVVTIAEALEHFYQANIDTRVFGGSIALSNFRDKSTRTRMSFASAASLLGLDLLDFDESKSQVAHGETVRETANMVSFLTEVIGIRDDLFLGYGHAYQAAVATAVHQGFSEGVLPQRPSVLNLQCDLDHPTQTLCDLLHLKQHFGSLAALRGKKIAMTWAYSPAYGKPMSVPQGIIALMSRFGMQVTLAHPEGYGLVPEIVDTAARFADESGGSFTVSNDMDEAFAGAHVVYPKSWAPVHIMQQRTDLLKAGRGQEVEALEARCIEANNAFMDWECTEERMALTDRGQALYMHCLPADITGTNCEHGEVATSVFERYWRETYHEAEHKLYVMAAMILLTRFPDPLSILRDLHANPRPRRR